MILFIYIYIFNPIVFISIFMKISYIWDISQLINVPLFRNLSFLISENVLKFFFLHYSLKYSLLLQKEEKTARLFEIQNSWKCYACKNSNECQHVLEIRALAMKTTIALTYKWIIHVHKNTSAHIQHHVLIM